MDHLATFELPYYHMQLVPLSEPVCHSHPQHPSPHESEYDFHSGLRTFLRQRVQPVSAPSSPLPVYLWSLSSSPRDLPMGSTAQAFHLYFRGHRTAVLWWNQACCSLRSGTPGAKAALTRAAWTWAQLATFLLPVWPPACRTTLPTLEVPASLFPCGAGVWAWTARALAQDQVLCDPATTFSIGMKARIAYASVVDAQRALGSDFLPNPVKMLLSRYLPQWTLSAQTFWAMGALKDDTFEERFPLILGTLTGVKADLLRGCPVEELTQARALAKSLNHTTYFVDPTPTVGDHGVGPLQYLKPAFLINFTRGALEQPLIS